MPLETQLGVKDESTYGTAVTVDRFQEFNSWSVELEVGRVESAGLRSGHKVQRSDRFVPYKKGAAGSVEFEVLSKGFGFWLKHMLGTVGTSGPTDSAYTHTGTIGSLYGGSFTAQVNKPFHPAGTNQAFTYEGGKVAKWSLACDVDGLLIFSADLVFEDGTTATALASASYPASMEHLSWAGGAITIGGSSVPVTSFKVECDNGLDVERLKQRASTLRQEPTENTRREITWELEADFESLTQYNRFASATASGALAAIVATWTAPTLIGASTYPSLAVTIDEARFDSFGAEISGPESLMQSLSGRGLYDDSNQPISVAYVTSDATP